MNNISKRYLLRVAINLYSVAFDDEYEFGGEIDEIDQYGSCINGELSEFCLSFLEMYYKKNKYQFIKVVNEISKIESERTIFFNLCCLKEIELILNNIPPLVFYWDDFYEYKKGDFKGVLDFSIVRSSNYLSEKRQLSIEDIKSGICDIISEYKPTYEGIARIILFGSVAKHTNTETSDIDLLLIFETANPLINRIAFVLKEEFRKKTGRILDVTAIVDGESNRFIEWILSYGIEVYCNEK